MKPIAARILAQHDPPYNLAFFRTASRRYVTGSIHYMRLVCLVCFRFRRRLVSCARMLYGILPLLQLRYFACTLALMPFHAFTLASDRHFQLFRYSFAGNSSVSACVQTSIGLITPPWYLLDSDRYACVMHFLVLPGRSHRLYLDDYADCSHSYACPINSTATSCAPNTFSDCPAWSAFISN